MRADFKAKLDALRAEVTEQRGGDGAVLDLPDWRSPHVEH
jgi:hypothetical protein